MVMTIRTWILNKQNGQPGLGPMTENVNKRYGFIKTVMNQPNNHSMEWLFGWLVVWLAGW